MKLIAYRHVHNPAVMLINSKSVHAFSECLRGEDPYEKWIIMHEIFSGILFLASSEA